MNRNLIATILIIAAIGIYFTITKAMVADAQKVKADNAQLVAALGSADQIIKARNDVTQQYNQISPDNRARIDKMIPSAVDNIRLVIDLNNLALQNHFALSEVKASVPSSSNSPGRAAAAAGAASYGAAVGEPILDKVQVSFSAETTYDQFMHFMQDLEANLRIMDLSHLMVTANADGTYSFSAQYQTYWLRQ
jgi:Tfp pilus assembly protein PilO